MAAANEVFNGNNLRVALVMTSATFNDVHASCRVWETERLVLQGPVRSQKASEIKDRGPGPQKTAKNRS